MSDKFGSPNMSDKTILVSVEDLINMALGPSNRNTVNFKLVQSILHILARQMRLLEQRVELRVADHAWDDEDEEQGFSKERVRVERSASRDRDKADKADRRTSFKKKAPASEKERAGRASFKQPYGSDRDVERGGRATSRERAAEDIEREEKSSTKSTKFSKARIADKELEDSEQDNEKREKGKNIKDRERYSNADVKERDKSEKADAYERKKSLKADVDERKKSLKPDFDERKKSMKPDFDERKKSLKPDSENRKKSMKSEDNESEKSSSTTKKGKGKERVASDTSIVITEVERKKEKVLVVEKGPTTRGDKSRNREGIEVVTRSQFDMMADIVKDLQKIAGPLPPPALPDNEKLRSDLLKGRASLTDTMQAMQVTARVRAAEQAISRMGELLTQLAAAGAIPEDVIGQIEDAMTTPATDIGVTSKSGKFGTRGGPGTLEEIKLAPSNMAGQDDRDFARTDDEIVPSRMKSVASRKSVGASQAGPPSIASSRTAPSALMSGPVTYADLEAALRNLRDDLTKTFTTMTTRSAAVAEAASNSTRCISVLELMERFKGLVEDLDQTMHEHRGLTAFQNQQGVELQSLIESVEMLREQKADRDEVLDGLRDKADISRLAGLLTAVEFATARLELEERLEVCHDKFRRQENVWLTALNDLKKVLEQKAELTQLLAAREMAENMLQELQDRQMRLALILGEPMAALLTRALSRDAQCGACRAPALMQPAPPALGAPPCLPAARPYPPSAPGDSCDQAWKPPVPPDLREHICHRWVGGSHTLLSSAVTREQAPPFQPETSPTARYAGYGDDGRLYRMEEELQPCMECNKFPDQPEESVACEVRGGGDQGPLPLPID